MYSGTSSVLMHEGEIMLDLGYFSASVEFEATLYLPQLIARVPSAQYDWASGLTTNSRSDLTECCTDLL